jgi:hypothetical protein
MHICLNAGGRPTESTGYNLHIHHLPPYFPSVRCLFQQSLHCFGNYVHLACLTAHNYMCCLKIMKASFAGLQHLQAPKPLGAVTKP